MKLKELAKLVAGEIAGGDLRIEALAVGAQLLPQLHRDQRAERVGGEVPELADRPVDVLQATVAVVAARIDAQVLHHLFVPDGRDVLGLDLAIDQSAFDLKAQDDVGRVGQLVRINADEIGKATLRRELPSE